MAKKKKKAKSEPTGRSKKSFGSCRADYSRRDEHHQYIDIPASEAARLLVALQNVVGDIIKTDSRRSERGVRLWLHSQNDDAVNITVYRRKMK